MSRSRRALVVAYYFPPIGGGGVNRTVKVVRGLVASGWQVTVLSADRAAWPQDPDGLEAVPDAVRVVRLPNLDWGRVARARDGAIGAPGRGAGRLQRALVPDLQVGWSALAAFAAIPIARAVDVVYTTCPPYSANAAGWLARRLGVPWVADFRDAWTLYPPRLRFPRWRRALERRLEAAVLRRADRVLFASAGVRDRYLRRAPSLEARSATVLTGFDARDFEGARGIRPPRGRLRIVHAGSALIDDRGDTVDAFLSALRAWVERDPGVAQSTEVRFVGAEPGLRARIAARGLEHLVSAHAAVPRARLASVLKRSHVCVYLSPTGANAADPIPGKLFDAAGAERPLFALAPAGPVSDLVRRLGLGVVADPQDRDAIVARLAELHRCALRDGVLPGPGAAARAELSSQAAVARVVETLESVSGAGRAACASR